MTHHDHQSTRRPSDEQEHGPSGAISDATTHRGDLSDPRDIDHQAMAHSDHEAKAITALIFSPVLNYSGARETIAAP